MCMAPEVLGNDNFSTASDVYALGPLLWQLCYYNNPRSPYMLEGTVPAPFGTIASACMKRNSVDRPTLKEVKAMLEAI
jgi:serine/threonine protein kinase